jgi:outer membrane receptor for ferric coprogen and ferric-rhodotorulic acid
MPPLRLFKIHPLVLALLLAAPAFAQTAANKTEKTNTLKTIKVTAAAETTTYTPAEVSIGKTAQSLKEIPQSVSVITRQKLDDQNISNLADAMKFVTGVSVQKFDGAGFFNTFNARGYAPDTFQIDGINLQNNSNMADTDLVIFDRVEVQRGAAGLFQGSGEPGVTVNMVRKRALAETRGQGMMSAGSWDSYRIEADATGALSGSGDLRGRLVAAVEDRDSYLDGINGNKQVVYGTLEYDFDKATTLSIGGTYQKIDSVIDQGLPAYANGSLLDVPRSTTIIADWNLLDMETADVFGEVEHFFTNGGQFKFTVRHSARERIYDGARANSAAAADGKINIANVYFPSNLEDTSADLFVNFPVQLGGQTHELIFGADYRTSDNESPYGLYTYSPASGTSNVFDHNHDTTRPTLVTVPNGYGSNTETNQEGVYARGKFQLADRWSLLIGGRLSWWDSEQTRTDTGAVVSPKYKEDEKFTPYAALMLDVTDTVALYASYSDIFKPQSNLTKNQVQLDPRTGAQYELGVKGEFLNGRINTHAALYRLQDENRALPDPTDNQFSIAAGEVRSEGFETEISGELTANWQITAGYAYTTTEYLTALPAQEGQSYSPSTPKNNVNLWSKYNFNEGALQGFYIGGGLRAVSDFYNGSNTLQFAAPGYTTVSLLAGYAIDDHWKLALNIDNVLDKKYYEKVSGASRQNFYGAPLSATVSLRGMF